MREYLTLQELKHMSLEKIERLQQLRFSATAQYMLPHVKAYRELFKEYNIDPMNLEYLEDWKKLGLPLMTKSYYKQRPKDFIVQVTPDKAFSQYRAFLQAQESAATVVLFLKALTHRKELEKEIKQYYMPKMPAFSGGTESGMPTPVFITARQKENLKKILTIAVELIFERFKTKDKLVGMNLFPYAPHLGWQAVHLALDLGADLNLSTAAGGAMSTEKLVELAEKTQANVYAGMNDYIRNRWLQVAIEKKAKLPSKALFINGATKLYEGERKKIKELAKKVGINEAIVLDFFGASELKEAIMPECAPGSGFHHIAPLSSMIRTIKTEKPAKNGLIEEWDFTQPGGFSATWNIDGAGSLLEGYVIGDSYEKITRNPCKTCGLRVERIFNINRSKETAVQLALTGMVEAKVKGSRIDLAALRGELLKLTDIAEVQIIARKTQLIILIAPETTRKKAEPKVKTVLRGLEVTPKVKWTTIKELTKEGALKYKGIKIES